MATKFRKPSKKTLIIAAILLVALIAIAITGTAVFLKDKGRTEAADLEEQQVNRQESSTKANNQEAQSGKNTENAVSEETSANNGGVAENTNAVEEGNVANNETTVTRNTETTILGTARTTANNNRNATTSNIQESTIIESNTVYTENPWETHNVSWEPIGVNAQFELANVDAKEDKIVVDKKADEKVKQGDKITYKITVENTADKPLNSIEVKDVLDDSILDVDSIEYVTKQEVNREGKIVTWTVNIEANSTVEIKFTVKVKTNVVPGTILKNSVVANGIKLTTPTETEIEEATKDITVNKEWKNVENEAARAHKVSGIVVKVNGTNKQTTLPKDGKWEDTITDLPKYNAEGKEIDYILLEEGLTSEDKAILTKYYKTPVINGGKIVNEFDLSKVDDTTTIKVEKEWKNTESDVAQAHKVSGIVVKVNGTNKQTTLPKDGKWEDTITDLPKYDAEGKEIDYTVSEEGLTLEDKDILTKYYKTPVINGGKIVNEFDLSKVDDTTTISGIKTWIDEATVKAQKPGSITVKLYADNEQVLDKDGNSVVALATGTEDVWTYSFGELPKYNVSGKEISYTIKELDANGNPVANGGNYNEKYVTTYEKNDIINTHLAPEITVTKSNHNDKQAIVKNGETITYDIKATNNGTAKGTVIITDDVPANSELYGTPMLTKGNKASNVLIEDLAKGYELELNKGETATISFTVTVNAYAGKEVKNTAKYKISDKSKVTDTDKVVLPVEADVNVIPTTTSVNPQKVILVLDTSGSMGYGVDGKEGHTPTRLSVLKDAAKEFLKGFLPKGTNNEVMIIEYATTARMICNYTSNVTIANDIVQGLIAGGGTNTDGALELANSKISKQERNTSVILMTDGLPTFYQDEPDIFHWDGIYGDGEETSKVCRDQAIASARLIKNKGSKVYTIGFGLGKDTTAKKFLESVATTVGDYYPSDNSEALNNAFSSIQNSINDGKKDILTTGINGTEKVESGVVVIENKYFKENQNIEIYTKPYISANDNNNKPQTYSWEDFEKLKVTEIDEKGNKVEIPVVEYVRDVDGKVTQIKFDLGKYMERNNISTSTKLTIRFVDSDKTKMKSANVFSLFNEIYSDNEVNEGIVAEYENKFNKAEQEKDLTTPIKPVEADKKTTENSNIESNKVDNNNTEKDSKCNVTENIENTENTENTEINSENETIKIEETPNELEQIISETSDNFEDTISEPDAE